MGFCDDWANSFSSKMENKCSAHKFVGLFVGSGSKVMIIGFNCDVKINVSGALYFSTRRCEWLMIKYIRCHGDYLWFWWWYLDWLCRSRKSMIVCWIWSNFMEGGFSRRRKWCGCSLYGVALTERDTITKFDYSDGQRQPL